jgi:putative ABC transport system permease protein
MSGIWQDARMAVRGLRRRPGFMFGAALTVGLGIGVNTAIFSVIDGVLLQPLSYQDPDELIVIGSVQPRTFGIMGSISNPEVEALGTLSTLSSVSATRSTEMAYRGELGAEMVVGTMVARGILELFGVRPALGRDMRPEEARDQNNHVIVLSHEFWSSRLGADPGAVGRAIVLDGDPYEIVGVAPKGWTYPHRSAFWVPGGTVSESCWWGCSIFSGVARMAPGATVASVQAELRSLAARLEEVSPRTQTGRSFAAETVHEAETGDVARGLWLLLGAAGLVLMIACANVANLLVVRGQARRAELAIRSALGASQARVLRAVLMESLVVAGLGTAVGVVMARLALLALPRLSEGLIPRLEGIAITPQVLAFTAGLVAFSVVVFGLMPGLSAARGIDLSSHLRGSARTSTGRRGRGRKLLITGEVALSLVLLVGAGLLLRTFGAIASVDPGFRTEGITRFDVSLPEGGYEDPAAVQAFVDQVEQGLGRVPGVREVSIGMGSPLTSFTVGTNVRFLDRPDPPPGEGPSARMIVVTPGHFSTYGLALLSGRGLQRTDRHGEPTAFVVNESFVRRYFPEGGDPIGAPTRTGVSFGYGRQPGEIVGVVSDARTSAIQDDPEPEVYIAHAQLLPTFFTVSVLAEPGTPVAVEARRVLADVDPNVPYYRLESIEDAVADEMASARFYLTLLGLFAVLALVLAGVGLYGVVAYAVSQRTREIGLRIALGSRPEGVVRMVVRQGFGPALAGVVLGLAVAAASASALASLLYGVPPRDPVTFVSVPLLLLAVTTVATLVPARRATKVDPVEALSAD